jgi:CheY-like chemotaxis protein
MAAMPPHGAGGPILVVEDEPGPRATMTRILRAAGYPVVAVRNGEEALARLRRDLRPSLVLLDLMLPVMDGFEFRVRQMQDPELADIPVIVLAGYADVERKAATLRPDACLRKPVDRSALLEVVRRRGRRLASRAARVPRRHRGRIRARPSRPARRPHGP